MLSGRSEIGLTSQGHAQSRALAAMLDGTPLASVHSSPRRRARETVAPLATRRRLEVRIAPALDEIDFGTFAGRSFAALEGDPAWRRWNEERGAAHCPGGEAIAEAVGRAAALVDALLPHDFPALCVTHGDIIRGLVADRIGLGFERMLALECEPASLTTLEGAEGGWRLLGLNERPRP